MLDNAGINKLYIYCAISPIIAIEHFKIKMFQRDIIFQILKKINVDFEHFIIIKDTF